MSAGPREKLLDTATELFYRHGINNVGIDRVLAESGVAKATLYRHFPSKDDLVLAFLDRINTEWMAWLTGRVEQARVEQRPVAVFDALGAWFETPSFRGCPFIGTAAEFRDPAHPVHRAAWSFKRGLRDYFVALLKAAGHRRSASLGDQLLLLADGAIIRAAMEGRADAAVSAKRAAVALLAHG